MTGGCAAPEMAQESAREATSEVVDLRGRVVDRSTGAPVPGAQVWTASGQPGTTDADGWFSLTVDADGRGAGGGRSARQIRVRANGYLDLRRGLGQPGAPVVVRLYPAHSDEGTDLRLSLRAQAPEQRRRGDESEPTPALSPLAQALSAAVAARGGVVTLADVVAGAPAPAVPTNIRVWRRGLDGSTDSCAGRVDVIGFEDYVKGVLPHEWIPSWDPKALAMGAVAIRTYAAWWVGAGGKYDCADLDDTTASQVYEDETLPKTDAAVDATTGMVIVKDGSLVFAEYSAENGDPTELGVAEPHCTGKVRKGHGRGTCQWGTQRWAQIAGKDFTWMAPHYYPGATLLQVGPGSGSGLGATFHGEDYPAEMTAGDEAVVWLEYANTGTTTWDTTNTRVGTTAPRDRESPFHEISNWISPSRPSAADHSGYGPGAVGRFSFVIRAPEVGAPTTFVEHFGLLQEGEAWFGPADEQVTWTITVFPRTNAAADAADLDRPDAGTDPGADPDGPSAFGCAVVAGAGTGRGPARAPFGRAGGAGFVLLAVIALADAVARRRRRRAGSPRTSEPPFAGRMVGAFAAAGLVLVGGGAGCGEAPAPGATGSVSAPTPAPAPALLGGDSALVPLIRAAAAESGVPETIVAGVAFSRTRLRMNLGREPGHTQPAYGLMALGDGGPNDVGLAAARLGLGADLVKTDAFANLRAGAGAIRAEADRLGLRPQTLGDWAPALAGIFGEPGGEDELYFRLGRGFRGKDDRGRWVVVSAVPLGEAYAAPPGARVRLGYPSALWNPAVAGNYASAARGAADINYVVVHTTQGSYSGTIAWFKDTAAKVSAHYVVRSADGQITQMVDDSDRAYHDACFNSESIGIEHEGFVDDPDAWYTEAMYLASAKLTAWLCDQYGIPKDRAHIMGHSETPDCSDHGDPGGGWDWAHYLTLVQSGGEATFDAVEGDHDYPLELTSGDDAVVWFEFENTSTITWGLDETRLGTAEPADRASPFFKSGNWLSPSRPTGADHSSYAPGATGRFTFQITAPAVDRDTVFVEKYRLVQEGVAWFGPTVTMTIKVKPPGSGGGDLDPRPPSGEPGGKADEGGDEGWERAGACGVVVGRRGGGHGVGGGLGEGAGLVLALLGGCAILGRVPRRRGPTSRSTKR
jgi:hypothetical protein